MCDFCGKPHDNSEAVEISHAKDRGDKYVMCTACLLNEGRKGNAFQDENGDYLMELPPVYISE